MTILGLTFNPVLGLPEAVSLGLVFFIAGLWLAIRAAGEARSGLRASLVLLRTLGLAALVLVWLNPGRWIDESHDTRRDWLVLLDRSRSMQAEHAPNVTRWQAGTAAATRLQKHTGDQGAVRLRTFSTQLEDEIPDPSTLAPDGTATDFSRTITTALDQRATPLAGIVIISDGRATSRARLDELALRARGRGVPIHTVPLVGNWGGRDLALTAMPRQITAFKGQPVKLSATLENRGLGPIKPAVALLGPDGKEIARKDATLTDGARATITFELPTVPETGGDYTFRTDAWPGEHLPSNNSDTVRINVLGSKTRVLLLEGAPYWDSKFLAQLLRQQGAVDILTVHRLNEERYFRVEAAGAEPLQSPDSVFPRTAAELSRYDLIVFGKGADGFVDPVRAAALQGFVRDQGGAILFARGKPYTGRFPPLEPLEPVEWGEDAGAAAKFTPLADTGAGLFGAALPAADDRVWPTLPPLDDVHTIARLKPFARVLAEGGIEGRETKLPLLVVRRFGRGMIATVNADGLWRWDFRPEVREQGAVYQQFWVQLMQWCATYSEFRPGEDYAVRVGDAAVEPGRSVRATIAWRGPATTEPKPVLKITRNGQPIGEAVATPLPAAEGSREWAAVITPTDPGRYEIRVADPARAGKLEGEARLTVLAPPAESDDLRPDPDTLATLARDSGGKVWTLDQLDDLAAQFWQRDPAAVRGKPRWDPLWSRWWVALLITLAFGGEWWLRRREGLL
jgi:hypothetical protein